ADAAFGLGVLAAVLIHDGQVDQGVQRRLLAADAFLVQMHRLVFLAHQVEVVGQAEAHTHVIGIGGVGGFVGFDGGLAVAGLLGLKPALEVLFRRGGVFHLFTIENSGGLVAHGGNDPYG